METTKGGTCVQGHSRERERREKERMELRQDFRYPHDHKHGPNNYKDTKPSMSSLLVFNRVYRLEIQLVMLVF